MDRISTQEPVVETAFSRTLTAPSNNPLRQPLQAHTLQSSEDDEIQLIRRFRKLEQLMAKEIRAYWDITFLTEYISILHIPRGLRIKKFPTSDLFDENFKKEWTDTLDTCSFKLMEILIASKKKETEKLQLDISAIQKDLTTSQTSKGFAELDEKLNRKLDRMEKAVIDTKKGKMARDKDDYQGNSVYTWNRSFHNSSKFRKNRGKRVSFSDHEGESADNTLARTASNSSLDRSLTPSEPIRSTKSQASGNPHRSRPTKKKKSSSRRQEEAVGNIGATSNSRYTLREKTQRK